MVRIKTTTIHYQLSRLEKSFIGSHEKYYLKKLASL